jgi:hypothetical protein
VGLVRGFPCIQDGASCARDSQPFPFISSIYNMFTKLHNLADIATVLNMLTTLGMPNTFGECTPLSTIAEPGTPDSLSDMDISSSMANSPSPLLFHIDLQDGQKLPSPIPIPALPPIDDLFKQNHKPQITQKTIPFTKPPCPMEEIWAERAAQEAAEKDGKEIKLSIIASNDTHHYTLDDWSLSPKSTAWDSPKAAQYMATTIARLTPTFAPMPHLEEDTDEEVDSTGLAESWPTPPSTPPAGDDMHPPTETFCAPCPGDE